MPQKLVQYEASVEVRRQTRLDCVGGIGCAWVRSVWSSVVQYGLVWWSSGIRPFREAGDMGRSTDRTPGRPCRLHPPPPSENVTPGRAR